MVTLAESTRYFRKCAKACGIYRHYKWRYRAIDDDIYAQVEIEFDACRVTVSFGAKWFKASTSYRERTVAHELWHVYMAGPLGAFSRILEPAVSKKLWDAAWREFDIWDEQSAYGIERVFRKGLPRW